MNHFSEMEWNWENLVAFGSKAIETEKKLQFTDWMIADDTEIDAGSFNISAGGGASGSDGGHVSSAKSSISASTDSSTKDGIQTPNFRLMSFEGFSRNFSNKPEVEGGEILKDASIGSAEPLIGLKLGKRTYFENSNVKGAASCSVMPMPSSTNLIKKTKSSGQNASPAPLCVVEGCTADLSSAKEYHRKHRVCDAHSKSPNVFVGGVERRFCQQCSRFHCLAEFDEKKRSCRRRLSDHNARRRKPPQETIQFNSTRLSTPFYEGRGFVLNNATYMFSRNTGNGGAPWNTTCNSKFTITRGYPPKPNVDGNTANGLMHMPGTKLPHFIHMLDTDNTTSGFLAASKNSLTDALNPVSKGSAMISSANADAAPDYRRALSLLSSNSWGSELSVPIHHPFQENGVYTTQQTIPSEGIVPLSPSDLWLTGHQPTHHHPRAVANNSNNFHKTPYEADFYSSIL